jgi:ribose-phosphate pyrophosphokinase
MKITCPSSNNDYYRKFTFPAGELHIVLGENILTDFIEFIDIEFNFFSNEDIFELLLLVHTLQNNNLELYDLIIPYMPFGQADRVNEKGECFSLKVFCDLINNVIKPVRVIVCDPHSDVTPALLNNCVVIPQWDVVYNIITENNLFESGNTILISPDAGAAKKIYKLALKFDNVGVVECSKVRDTSNGKILKTEVHTSDFCGSTCIIVDDICVGGRTFIEIAKILRTRNAGKIILCTTNGVYSQGLEVFSDIDEIYNRKGKVK